MKAVCDPMVKGVLLVVILEGRPGGVVFVGSPEFEAVEEVSSLCSFLIVLVKAMIADTFAFLFGCA